MKSSKEIRVYLQYPWRFPDSPQYKYLIDSPPKGVKYLNVDRQRGVMTDRRTLFASNYLKRAIRLLAGKLRLPIINAHFTKSKEHFDLIHCAHCLSLNADKPWVADFESLWQVYVGQKTGMGKRMARRIFLGKNCKKIIVWTKKAMDDFESEFPEVKEKIELVYPAIPSPKTKKLGRKNVNLLFVARSFYEKGGLDALRSIDVLTRKYSNVNAMIVSKVPEGVEKMYSKNKKIRFFGLLKKSELEKVYSETDILIYPGYTDTFGFGIVECMSFGIPPVSVSGFLGRDSKKEIIADGKNGFLVSVPKGFSIGKTAFSLGEQVPLSEAERRENPEIIEDIVKKASMIIENPRLRKKMSKNCRESVKNGKFSTKERNKKLKKIYDEVLK